MDLLSHPRAMVDLRREHATSLTPYVRPRMVDWRIVRGAALKLEKVARVEHEPHSAEPVPPPLKWAGGKRWQVQHVLPYWLAAGDRRLVEPFAGGLAVTLGLMPKRALLNDINPHVINFYAWLKKGFLVEQKFVHTETAYYKART